MSMPKLSRPRDSRRGFMLYFYTGETYSASRIKASLVTVNFRPCPAWLRSANKAKVKFVMIFLSLKTKGFR